MLKIVYPTCCGIDGAHKEKFLEELEAMLVIKIGRTLLHYLNSKFRAVPEFIGFFFSVHLNYN